MKQVELLRYVVEQLEVLQLPYMIVGSFASAVYGDARYTRDIDIVVQLSVADLDKLLAVFPEKDFYFSRPAAIEAIRTSRQFNVIDPVGGSKIDFMVARRDDWGKVQISRREQKKVLPDLMGYVARPEDVILGKLIYHSQGDSEKHITDIQGMFKESKHLLDMDYLADWAVKLAVSNTWQKILASQKTS